MSTARSSRKAFWADFNVASNDGFERFRGSYQRLLETTLEHRGVFATRFIIFCVLSLGLVFFLGQDFFPQVDAGLIRLHFRARSGLRVEETARLCDQVEKVLRDDDSQSTNWRRCSITSAFPTRASIFPIAARA